MAIKCLCTADLHLGRVPTRLPEQVDRTTFSTRQAWNRLVDRAIERQVDFVLMAGDVVDAEQHFYEAAGAMESGMLRLENHNIDVVCVSGNHDATTLPRIIETVGTDNLTCLGQGQNWETKTFETESGTVQFVGWSFAQSHCNRDPIGQLEGVPTDAQRVVGLLHCDVDNPESNYAPVDSDGLRDSAIDTWVLGHIHRRYAPLDNNEVFYPGSPQPLDPSEGGRHGVELLELSDDGATGRRTEAISNLQYTTVEIDISDAKTPEQVDDLINRALEETRRSFEASDQLEQVVTRPVLTGRTSLYEQLDNWVDERLNQYHFQSKDISISVESLENQLRPDYNLEALAAESNEPPGEVAKLLLALDEGAESDEQRKLLDEIINQLGRVYRANAFRPLLDNPTQEESQTKPGRAQAAEYLRETGYRLIDELMKQKGTNEQ